MTNRRSGRMRRITRRTFLKTVGAGAAGLALSRYTMPPTAARAYFPHLLPGGYLSTSGAQILSQDGAPVKLAGVNWYGMDCTAQVPGGLDQQHRCTLAQTIVSLGFNHIRLPFSIEAATSSSPITVNVGTNVTGAQGHMLDANTDLYGLTPLQIMDHVIAAAGGQGLKVILDCHRSDAGWSTQENGLWYTDAYPESQWISTLQSLARRYNPNLSPGQLGASDPWGDPIVIGMDLRNEPGAESPAIDKTGLRPLNAGLPYPENRTLANSGAVWGNIPDPVNSAYPDPAYPSDWQAAAQRAGSSVLDPGANPNLLVFAEGVRYDPGGPSSNNNLYWFGGNLAGARVQGGGVSLHQGYNPSTGVYGPPVTNKLVYSIHDYGPDNHGVPWCAPGPYPGSSPGTDQSSDQCFQTWDQIWGYLASSTPIWIGEFGTENGYRNWYYGRNQPPTIPTDPLAQNAYTDRITNTGGFVQYSQGAWFTYLMQYIQQRGIHWCYWSLNGTQSQAPGRDPSSSDFYGILRPDWAGAASQPLMSKLATSM